MYDYTSSYLAKTPAKYQISDSKVDNLFGIAYFNQKDIDALFKRSGKLAVSNEFQCHYTALTGITNIENQILLINIPLVYFNYDQKVGTSSVEFELKDVIAKNDGTIEYAKLLAQDCMNQKFIKSIEEVFGKIDWVISQFNTIHRHPGQLSSFSGTDYDKNPENPGICFPLSKADNSPSFSSIICPSEGTMKIVHTETRVANGSVDEKTMNYYHGRTFTYVQGYESLQTQLEKLFAVDEGKAISDYFKTDRCSATIASELIKISQMIQFQGCTENIDEKHISAHVYAYASKTWKNGRFVDDDDDEYFLPKKDLPSAKVKTSRYYKGKSGLLVKQEDDTIPAEDVETLVHEMDEEFKTTEEEPMDETAADFKPLMIDFIYDSVDEIGQFDVDYDNFSLTKKTIFRDLIIEELSILNVVEGYFQYATFDRIIEIAHSHGLVKRHTQPSLLS